MFRIAVVGAGIAGTAAALSLARAGHRVELFERAPVLGPVGAGLLLQPSGQAVLRDLGLLPAVTNRSEPIAELRPFWTGATLRQRSKEEIVLFHHIHLSFPSASRRVRAAQ